MLVAPDAEAVDPPRDAPLGVVIVLAEDDGRPLTNEDDEGVDAAVAAVDEGAGLTNPLGAGELKVGDVSVGGAIDGAVSVDVAGTFGVGDDMTDDVDDVMVEDDPTDVPTLLNGRGAGVVGAAGRGKHGAGSVWAAEPVCVSESDRVVGLGFATG
jgi:hypothetical protein